MRGVRLIQGNSLHRPRRNPITISHLWAMLGFLESSNFSEHDKMMWHCTIVVAFFGLLRVSEFTCPSAFDPSIHLSPRDVSFNPSNTIMYINIKASKTDPFRSGVTVRLAAIPHHHHHLSRKYVVALLRITLLGVVNINTHSFRIGKGGGIRRACRRGLLAAALIRIMGRWSSDCFNRYIRISDTRVSHFQRDLSVSHVNKT